VKPAVFLDRDGTVIEEVHYIADPAHVRVLPGAADAIRSLHAAGYACVLITNQSAVGRGIAPPESIGLVQHEVERQLTAAGASIDGFYFCTEPPQSSDRATIDHPDRKPGPGMLLRAARELDLDLGRSWMVGDMLSDLLAGRNAGCRAVILVRTGHGARSEPEAGPSADHVADDLAAAAGHILRTTGAAPRDVAASTRKAGHS
jgi:D-glycero-D-manno-heptose 1,7-bisphosphate phosphatase